MEYKIYHTALIMRDRDEAVEFFVDKLGMELLVELDSPKRGGTKLQFGVNGKYLFEVFAIPSAELETNVECTTGHNHVAFEVPDVATALKELGEKGVKVTEAFYDAPADSYYGFFYGPDDVKFEFYQVEE